MSARESGGRRFPRGFATSVRRTTTLLSIGLRENARNSVLVGLLITLPIVFITVAIAVTQDAQMPIELTVDGETRTVTRGLPEVHGIAMMPITSALIAGIVGLLLMRNARTADGRLVLTGYRAREVIAARFATLAALSLLVTAVSLVVLALDVVPEQPLAFVAATLAVTLLYGLVGMMLGVLVDRLAGLWTVLVAVMLDVGVFQSPLFAAGDQEWWMTLLPGYHPMQVVLDAGLTSSADALGHLGWTLAYLLVVIVMAIVAFYREVRLT